MKSLLSTTIIVCYSFFSFLFSALCPAICLGSEDLGICPAVCESKVNETPSCCSAPCNPACDDAEPLVVCSGAYGTQNSLRCTVDCPAPAKTPATIESTRLFKDIVKFSPTFVSGERIVTAALRHSKFDNPLSSLCADIIATTVLRI